MPHNPPPHNDLTQKIAALEKEIETQKQAADRLQKIKNDWENIFHAIGHPAMIIDPEFNVISANQTALKAVGMSMDEMRGKKCHEVFHQLAEPPECCPYGMLLKTGKNEPAEMIMEALGRIHLVSCTPVMSSSGRIEKLIHVATDITDRYHDRQALQKSEEKYRRIFESIQDVYYQTDITGIIHVISPSVKNIIGYDPDELIGQSVLDFYKDPEAREMLTQEIIKSGYVQNFNVEFNTKTGGTVIGSLNSRMISDGDGQAIGFEGIIRDVTDHRKVEEEVTKAHQELSQIFNATVPMCVIDHDYHFVRVNDHFADFFGIEKETAVGMKCHDICQWPICQTESCVLKKILNSETPDEYEISRETAAGKKISCIVAASPFRDIDGRTIGAVETIADITQRTLLEEQLRQAQRIESIGTLAGGIAHDFNNILSAIIGFTELSLDDTEAGTMLHDNLTEIMTAGNRARDLVQQILAFSRHDESEIRPVQITPIVKEVVKMLRATIPSSIQINETLCPEKLIVNADPTQLHQVIVNLATNAKQAMAEEEAGVLEIFVNSIFFDEDIENQYPDLTPGDYVCITVSDTGTGILKADLEKIFDPYFTTKQKGDGSGLGLFVVHGIVKKYRGAITVYSEPGKGTTFHVYLPLIKKYSLGKPSGTFEPLPTGTEHILMVDDEPTILKMQQQVLERLGYQVVSRVSSLEALEAFRGSPEKFDLVITDMTMPHITGDRLSREIKKLVPDMPVVLCTGFSEKVDDSRASALHIDGFLMKPVNQAQLANIVRSVLDSRVRGKDESEADLPG